MPALITAYLRGHVTSLWCMQSLKTGVERGADSAAGWLALAELQYQNREYKVSFDFFSYMQCFNLGIVELTHSAYLHYIEYCIAVIMSHSCSMHCPKLCMDCENYNLVWLKSGRELTCSYLLC